MGSRTLGPSQPTKTRAVQAPTLKVEWQKLLRTAIARAEQAGDRRVHGLRQALADGESEAALRRISVIHEGDLDREFPLPSK